MQTDKGHLTYCSNIHAGESWEEHFTALKKNFPLIKEEVSPSRPMGLGLRLSNAASIEILQNDSLTEFKEWLINSQAYVFTMNGFPYGGFHYVRVKDQVHAPDWTTNERVEYTLRLFGILKELLPEGMDGGVSTSPLSYRHWFDDKAKLQQAKEKATTNILKIAAELINIKQVTGQVLHLDIEPEPDGILETGTEFIEWFENELLPAGKSLIAGQFSVTQDKAEELIKEHIRLCYDVCHFAVGYESHSQAINKLQKTGIKIGKFQISAALKAILSPDTTSRNRVYESFSVFNESTYLHQVVARMRNGQFLRYPDLPEALNDINNAEVEEWRAHFHVPVFEENFDALQSTQSDISEILAIQKAAIQTQHIEVETYTWEVLPEKLKLPLHESIIRELLWVIQRLESDTDIKSV